MERTTQAGEMRTILVALRVHESACTCPCHDWRTCEMCIEGAMKYADVMAARAQEIAREVGLDGQPIARYRRLVQDCNNNFRAVLNQIEAGTMIGGEA